ncbi:MAG: hypothetical protein ABI895_24945 [Deltaproteobacteria bacterium]
MISVRTGFVLVGCVVVGFVTSSGTGLVARAAEPQRWVEPSAASEGTRVAAGGEAQRRIAQLEQRLKELEAERPAATPSSMTPSSMTPSSMTPSSMTQSSMTQSSTAGGNTSDQLDAVVTRNNELLARNLALAAENEALAQGHLFETPVTATACEPPPGEAPKAQLRYWAERLRDGASRLTVEQNAALNVLLRHERELDPHNPWRDM